jgi:hypothetical protein
MHVVTLLKISWLIRKRGKGISLFIPYIKFILLNTYYILVLYMLHNTSIFSYPVAIFSQILIRKEDCSSFV